jgi:hypothetical protein
MTKGRVGRQHTWNALPDELRERAYLVVPDEEGKAHVESGIPLRAILFAPSWVKNYSDKFKYLLELDDGFDKAVIIDDDLKFSIPHVSDGKRRLHTVRDQSPFITKGFKYMEELLDDTALVSFHPRQMGHTKEPPYTENGKVVCVQGINRKLCGSIPDLNKFPILADVVLNATLLSRGVGNKIHRLVSLPSGGRVFSHPHR